MTSYCPTVKLILDIPLNLTIRQVTATMTATMTSAEDHLDLTVHLDTTIRVFLAAVAAVVALCGTLGNFLVWFGSIFRSAIRMEPCSRVLITNLALSDIIISLIYFLPLSITLGAGSWVLGQPLCQFQGVAIQIAICLEILIMMSLNCYRLWAVRKTPGDRERVKVWQVHCYLILVLLVCGSVPLVHTAVSGWEFQTSFDNRVGLCRIFLARKLRAHNIIDLCYLVPPLVISFTANKVLKCILCTSAKRAGSSNPKSQRAISLVCWAMIISYLPCYVVLVWEMTKTDVPDAVYVARAFIMSINLTVNPIIYFVYSDSFNSFVRTFFSVGKKRATKLETRDTFASPETSI